MPKYRLVNNWEYDLKGVYYRGLNKKYHDMFDITTSEFAKTYDIIEEAHKDREMLKRCFGYEYFEVEEVE